jgi:ribonuclease P/MRP protein subunit RPP40
MISESQHEFRAGRSCQTNLLEFLDKMTEWADNRDSIVVYLYFAKAFDKVCHERLIVKVEAAGISVKVNAWLRDWLKNRLQRVILESEQLEWMAVISSVIQGSLMGSTLLKIFIDDIDKMVLAFIKKFADDTKAARVM